MIEPKKIFLSREGFIFGLLIILICQITVNVSAFSIVIIGDTQQYAYANTNQLNNITEWIVNNSQSLDIRAVMHMGDLVDDNEGRNETEQWIKERKAFDILDNASIPYLIARGNHDDKEGFINNFGNLSNYIEIENNTLYAFDYRNESEEIDYIRSLTINSSNRFILAEHKNNNLVNSMKSISNQVMVLQGHLDGESQQMVTPTLFYSVFGHPNKDCDYNFLDKTLIRYYIFENESIIGVTYSINESKEYTKFIIQNGTLTYLLTNDYLFGNSTKYSVCMNPPVYSGKGGGGGGSYKPIKEEIKNVTISELTIEPERIKVENHIDYFEEKNNKLWRLIKR